MKTIILLASVYVASFIVRLTRWPRRLEAELDALSYDDLRRLIDLLFAALASVFWAAFGLLTLIQIAHIIASQGGL